MEPSSLGVSGAPGMEPSSLGVDKLVALTYSESHISHHHPLPEPSHHPVEHSIPGGAHANYTFLSSRSRRSLGHEFANFVNGRIEYMMSFLLMVAEDISPAWARDGLVVRAEREKILAEELGDRRLSLGVSHWMVEISVNVCWPGTHWRVSCVAVSSQTEALDFQRSLLLEKKLW